MSNKMAYKSNVSEVIFNGIKAIVKRRSSKWVGTMTDLGELLETKYNSSNLPGSASALRVALNKVVNKLRNAGIGVKFTRSTNHMRTRLVEFVSR